MFLVLQQLQLFARFVTTFLAFFLKSGETVNVRLNEDLFVLHLQIFHMFLLEFLLTV